MPNSWVQLALATADARAGSAPRFYRAAWAALRAAPATWTCWSPSAPPRPSCLSVWVMLAARRRSTPTSTASTSRRAVVVLYFILLGKWLEARAKRGTGAAIRALLELRPRTALPARGRRDGARGARRRARPRRSRRGPPRRAHPGGRPRRTGRGRRGRERADRRVPRRREATRREGLDRHGGAGRPARAAHHARSAARPRWHASPPWSPPPRRQPRAGAEAGGPGQRGLRAGGGGARRC